MSEALHQRTVDWKEQSRARLENASRLKERQELQECLFQPQLSSHRPPKPPATVRPRSSGLKEATSVQEHLARQRKARKQASDRADRAVPHGKGYSGAPTVPEPFKLGTPSGFSASLATPTPSSTRLASTRRSPSTLAKDTCGRPGAASTREIAAWDEERRNLVSIIDAQQRQLGERAKAQSEAVAIAERFASAVLLFEERLQAMEARTQQELRALRDELPSAVEEQATQRAVAKCVATLDKMEKQLQKLTAKPDPFDQIETLEKQVAQLDRKLASRAKQYDGR